MKSMKSMKKMTALALATALFLTPVMSTARAAEPIRSRADAGTVMQEDAPEGRRGSRNYRRGNWNRGGNRRGNNRGGALGAGIAGAIIGGLIAGAIKSAGRPKTPTLYCDQYGNCRHQQ